MEERCEGWFMHEIDGKELRCVYRCGKRKKMYAINVHVGGMKERPAGGAACTYRSTCPWLVESLCFNTNRSGVAVAGMNLSSCTEENDHAPSAGS